MKNFTIILEDDFFEDGLDINCWGYDTEDAINSLRVTYKQHGLSFPKVISTTEIIKKPNLFQRLFK